MMSPSFKTPSTSTRSEIAGVWEVMGASVRGPHNRCSGKPNQDAWLGRARAASALAVVCDGLGSRDASDHGARAACLSVAHAVRIWSSTPGAPEELLLRLLHAMWNIRVYQKGRHASATTCQFAVVTPDRRLILAQLGDGIIALRSKSEQVVLESVDRDFSNMTTGLGVSSDIRDWRIHSFPITAETIVLLATDGIADDLEPSKQFQFLEYLMAEYACLPVADRSRALATALRAWPTPHHRDDKTIAVLWWNPNKDFN